MTNTAPITLEQLFRFYRGLPHQMAAIALLEQDIKTAGYAVAMRRDREWFKVWSQGGKIVDPVDIALPEIKAFENCKLTAYPDPRTGGEPITIGWGSTTYANGNKVKMGDTITQQKADELLDIRVRNDTLRLERNIPNWALYSPQQQAALISFTYNVGPNWYGGEGFSTITARIRSGQTAMVPNALMLYVNPGSDVEEGLRNRRKREGALWREGSAPVAPPKVNIPTQQPAKPGRKIPPYLLLTRTRKVDSRGLELLRLQRVKDGITMNELLVVSGAPGRQVFKKGADSVPLSAEPLPEGLWAVDEQESTAVASDCPLPARPASPLALRPGPPLGGTERPARRGCRRLP
jgi:lysozyme